MPRIAPDKLTIKVKNHVIIASTAMTGANKIFKIMRICLSSLLVGFLL